MTNLFIRERLSSLDKYMAKVDSDISLFNQHVMTQVKKLNSHGKTSNNLLANLFKGYKAASDCEFKQYIKKRQEEFNDSADCNAITPDRLMHLALNKYKSMLEAGEWKLQTDDELKIIALKAKIEKLTTKVPKNTGMGAKGGGKGDSKKAKSDKGFKECTYPSPLAMIQSP